jgi:hypothetical protein
MIKLTRDDWQEISEAIAMKLKRVQDGEYMIPAASSCSEEDKKILDRDEKRIQRAWIADLKRLEKKLGDDGERAIRRGVAPIPKERTT